MSGQRPRIRVLGAGRAGCSLAAALGSAGYPVSIWTRSPATAAAAAKDGFHVHASPRPERFEPDELVLLAVRDDALPQLAASLADESILSPGTTIAHLAGSLDLGCLELLRQAGARVGSLHPLVSLATRRSPLAGAAAALDAADSQTDALLSQVASAVGLEVIRPAGSRALYHAAACLAGNYPQVLLEAAVELLERTGLARPQAHRALSSLMQSAVRNATDQGPAGGLTGPIARGDARTVARHLEAIGDDPAIESLYRAAGRMALRVAPLDDAALGAVLGDDEPR